MLVGSHGLEEGGWTNDIELSVGVADGNTGPNSFVGRFRRALWGEHLQLPSNATVLEDPLAALGEWERQAATGTARVRRYWPRNQPDGYLEDKVYELYEPEGRCGH